MSFGSSKISSPKFSEQTTLHSWFKGMACGKVSTFRLAQGFARLKVAALDFDQ
jgi:hypothetical protein